MDPFIIELHRFLSLARHFGRQMLDEVGLLIIIGVVLVSVLCAVLSRWQSRAPDKQRTCSVVFARGNKRASRKLYDFERLMTKLREIFRAAAVGREEKLIFSSIEATRFVVFYGTDESIEVAANTVEDVTEVYWELITILGRIPESVWAGDMNQAAVLHKMHELAFSHKPAK